MQTRFMRLATLLLLITIALIPVSAQRRKAQNKPYIDLRPLHFGIEIGLNMQDLDFRNVGPQTIVPDEGEPFDGLVLTDVDIWNPGFSVGVVADWRLGNHLSFRAVPTMHFGGRRLVYRNMLLLTESGHPTETTQDMKSTYMSVPLELKFSAQRFNNHRPYMLLGLSPMLNLSARDQDAIHLRRYDAMIEAGIGCDFYLPFFKLIPEIKFCYGLMNAFDKGHASELRNAAQLPYAKSINAAQSKMVVLTFYFE